LLISFGLLALFVKKVERAKLSDFGMSMKNAIPELSLGVVVGALLVAGVVAVMFLLGVYQPTSHSSGSDLLLAAGTLFFAAVTEELIFRSYALNVLEKHWGTIAAVIVSSAAFGFAHMLNDAGGSTVQSKFLFCTFLSLEAGVSLAACYVFTRRLWMPIGAHWMWNFFEGPVFGTHVSGADFGQSLLTAKIEGPMLLTGGKFGPEGSVICLVLGTIAGVVLLHFSKKRDNLISYETAQNRLKNTTESNQIAA
jgi:membrane protease YdiL (CAAX protease family)